MNATIKKTAATAAAIVAIFGTTAGLTACGNSTPASQAAHEVTVTFGGKPVKMTLIDAVTGALSSKPVAADVKFASDLAPSGTNNWGPTQQAFSSVKDAGQAFTDGMVTYRDFAASIIEAWKTTGGPDKMTVDGQYGRNQGYVSNTATYQQEVDYFLKSITRSELAFSANKYDSYGIVPKDGDRLPTLTSMGAESVEMGQMLVLYMNDGVVLKLRIACFFQLSEERLVVQVVVPATQIPLPELCTSGPNTGLPVSGGCPTPSQTTPTPGTITVPVTTTSPTTSSTPVTTTSPTPTSSTTTNTTTTPTTTTSSTPVTTTSPTPTPTCTEGPDKGQPVPLNGLCPKDASAAPTSQPHGGIGGPTVSAAPSASTPAAPTGQTGAPYTPQPTSQAPVVAAPPTDLSPYPTQGSSSGSTGGNTAPTQIGTPGHNPPTTVSGANVLPSTAAPSAATAAATTAAQAQSGSTTGGSCKAPAPGKTTC